MTGFEGGEQRLHRLRERVPRGVHAGEQGVASALGHRMQVQHRAHRRLCVARYVAVPAVAVLAGRIHVRVDEHQLGAAVDARRGGMDVEFAEAPPECEMPLVVDGLVAEENDAVRQQGSADLGVRLVFERLAKIDVEDFGSDRRGERFNRNSPVRHRMSPELRAVARHRLNRINGYVVNFGNSAKCAPSDWIRLSSRRRRGPTLGPPDPESHWTTGHRTTGFHPPAGTDPACFILAKIACCSTRPELVLGGRASIASNAPLRASIWSATLTLRRSRRRRSSSRAEAIRHASTKARSSVSGSRTITGT